MLLLFLFGLPLHHVLGLSGSGQGPVFVQEPDTWVHISNRSGALLACSARGNPQPDIHWLDNNARQVSRIPSLREVLLNGSLLILPFKASQFNDEVHATTYRCRASNIIGTIVSRPSHLTADMDTSYHLRVQDVVVITGNVAVLSCDGASVRDSVLWFYEQPVLGRTVIHSGGRFTVTGAGALHVRDTEPEDAYARFSCQATSTVTGERRVSMPGKIVVLGAEKHQIPRIDHVVSKVNGKLGSTVELECIAQGYPPPHYQWFKEADGTLVEMERSGSILIQPLDSVLRFHRVRQEDGGKYTCVAANSFGEDRREINLAISSHLSVQLHPAYQVVDGGSDATFNCSVRGGTTSSVVEWLKDGQSLTVNGKINFDILKQQMIVKSISKQDQGMYQCFAKSSDGEITQASAELAIGAIYPELQSTFIEQTLQPGMTVSLKCVASGNPPPRVSWLLDGGSLLPRGGYVLGSFLSSAGLVISHLNITVIRVEHGGLYTCQARNSLGSAQHSASLNIYGPPSPRSPVNMTGVLDGSVWMRCPVAGYPIVSTVWQHQGDSLPTSYSQRVFSNGSLHLSRVSATDKGEYRCTVKNQQSQAASGRIYLNVMKPPEISPFQFSDDLQEGSRTHVVCAIIFGDLPMEITWNKDGRPLAHDPDIQEQSLQFVSNLVFNKLSARHAGYYTCVAKNAAAQANRTAKLVIKVPPSWIIEPQDVSVLYQHSLTMPCYAAGFPVPKVRWTKQIDHQGDEFSEIESNAGEFISENGTLFIHATDTSQQGRYTCTAENGIGKALKKSIYVKVNVPAHFKTKIINQSGMSGQELILKCEAEGELPLRVSWSTIPVQPLPPAHSRHTSSGLISEIQFHNFSRKHAGAYHCNANNEFGQDNMVIYLTIKEPPGAPRNLDVMEVGSRWLSIRWLPPSGVTPTSQFLVQFQNDAATLWNNITVNGNTHTAHVSALIPLTVYFLRVIAINDVGSGLPSEIIRAVTLQEAPSKQPQDVMVEAVNQKSLVVRWKYPDFGLSRANVIGYHISYREPGSQLEVKTARGHERQEFLLSGLKQFTRYEVTVDAFNDVGSGPPSHVVIATTLQGVPEEPPQEVQCLPVSSQSLNVRWEPPPKEYCNGELQGYKIFYKQVDPPLGAPAETEVKKSTNLETNLDGLIKFANYSIRVVAYTSAGEGVRSPPIYCSTDEDVPGPPDMVKGLVMTSDSIMVVWTPPSKPNGVILKYNVYISGQDKEISKEVIVGSRILTYEWRRLKEFQRYNFWVTASTSVGEGEPSNKFLLFPMSRGMIYHLHTVFPKTLESNFCILVDKTSTHICRVLDDGSLLLNALTPDMAGNYTCLTENVFGRDQVVYQVVVITEPEPPVLVVLTSTSNTISLQWRTSFDGGAHITGYKLSYQYAGSRWQHISLEADRKNYVLGNLLCGTKYELYLKASNSVGESSPSTIIHAATKGQAPGRSEQDEFVTVNSTSAMLYLENWPNGGCPVTFKVTYRAHGENNWKIFGSSISPQDAVVMSNLKPATYYYLRIEISSDSGRVQHEYIFATRSLTGEMISLELGPEKSFSVLQWNILFPAASIIICIFAILSCVYMLTKKRSPQEFQSNETSGIKSLMELENQRNDHQCHAYSPSPSRKVETKTNENGSDYEICPYATLNLQTMAHSMQFETFSQRDCYSGQPPSSGAGGHYSSRARLKDKMNMSASPSDGLDLEISCISSQQTLPIKKKRVLKDEARTRFNCHYESSSCDKPMPHYTPSHLSRNADSSVFDLDSSTESAEASPEVKRSKRGASSRIQPPTEFSDNREVSDVECDRERDNLRLQLLDHSKFEKQLYSRVKMYRQDKNQESYGCAIHV
ncbi:Down syndrome cell adhesion molecule-like protein Dscam2 [Nilaparvata lugens]|uniref:Down syndrome cell adhesion molecule-like protein Dscam2 n=1 Tax=Nilaparvata lugens TaxID=108931 RepID=UPI00193EA67C|nr:Down syndrome cell adhesion molecule-like protein Dscam2 [Nilaparvata lugens]